MELFNNSTINLICFILTLIIVLIVNLIPKFENNKLVQSLGIILIIFLTFVSKAELCYMLLIVYIAIKFKIIDDNLLTKINELSKAKNGKYSNKKRNNIDDDNVYSERIEEIKQVSNDSDTIKIKVNDIVQDYNKSEKDVINWFVLNENLIFEPNRKIITNDSCIYPDGIYETKSFIGILEVKYFFKGSESLRLIKYGLETLQRNKIFYQKSEKTINLYLAIVLNNDEKLATLKEFLDKHNINNLYVYIFKQENNNLKLLEYMNF